MSAPVKSIFGTAPATNIVLGLSSVSAIQALAAAGIGIRLPFAANEEDNLALLRDVLAPFRSRPNLRKELKWAQTAVEEFHLFIDNHEHQPSGLLFGEIERHASEIKTLLDGISAEEGMKTTSPVQREKRSPLEYVGRKSSEALAQQEQRVREAVDRLLTGVRERAGVTTEATPPVLSFDDVLNNPEKFTDKELEIVLFDVDGTTNKGELPGEGQLSIAWFVRDVLRYGPKQTVGLGWPQIIRAMPSFWRLRAQEKREGSADREKFFSTFRPLLDGLSGQKARQSFDRFYAFGKEGRGDSRFMLDEFAHHRRMNRLILGVSASYEYLVKMHGDRDLGIPRENIWGTSLGFEDDKPTGEFKWLHGEEKVRTLKEEVFKKLNDRKIKHRIVAAYSDSPSDWPMLNLAKENGGVIIATNSSKEDFNRMVLAEGGMAVEESDGWWGNGKRKVVFFDTAHAGKLSHEVETPPVSPAWVKDAKEYGVRSLSDAAGLAVGSVVAKVGAQTLDGKLNISTDLLSQAPAMAVAGFIGAAVANLVVPETGPVSWQRKVMVKGTVPLLSALWFSGQTGDFGSFFINAPVAVMTAMAAVGIAETVTVGGRLTGYRQKGGDEAKHPVRKFVGSSLLRSFQVGAYRVLTSLLQKLGGG